MKVSFEDNSYIDVSDSIDGSLNISVGARNYENRLSMVVNSVTINKEQVISLFGRYFIKDDNDI